MRLSGSTDAPFFDATQECQDMDVNLFYATEEGYSRRFVDFAKSLCERCVFKDQCLAWALKNERYGIWGGKTAREREQMLKGRAA